MENDSWLMNVDDDFWYSLLVDQRKLRNNRLMLHCNVRVLLVMFDNVSSFERLAATFPFCSLCSGSAGRFPYGEGIASSAEHCSTPNKNQSFQN